MSQTLNAAIAVVGIDIGKNSFHIVPSPVNHAAICLKLSDDGHPISTPIHRIRSVCSARAASGQPATAKRDELPPS
jgi:hypothetical protein